MPKNAHAGSFYDETSSCRGESAPGEESADILNENPNTKVTTDRPLAALADRQVSDQAAGRVVLRSLAIEPTSPRLFSGLVDRREVFLVCRVGIEESVQPVDTKVELETVGCEEALTEVEDRFLDGVFVRGAGDPAVAQKVLFQDDEFVRGDLQCVGEVGFLLL